MESEESWRGVRVGEGMLISALPLSLFPAAVQAAVRAGGQPALCAVVPSIRGAGLRYRGAVPFGFVEEGLPPDGAHQPRTKVGGGDGGETPRPAYNLHRAPAP